MSDDLIDIKFTDEQRLLVLFLLSLRKDELQERLALCEQYGLKSYISSDNEELKLIESVVKLFKYEY